MNQRQRRRRELLTRQADALAPFLRNTETRHILCPLCLQLIPEESWPHLSIEDAPPRQYSGEERCMTCTSGNNRAGGTYETRVRIRNDDRTERIARASPFIKDRSGLTIARTPLYTPVSIAYDLASPSRDEFRLELKSAYLIAYVTLGHRYILDPGLDQVRDLIDPDHPEDAFRGVRPCARVKGLPADGVIVARDPVPCVIVPHPSSHHRGDSQHVVFLPVPGADDSFYRRLGLLDKTKFTVSQAEHYQRPGPRRLSMHWDVAGHPLQTRTAWASDPVGDDPPITIDLR